MTNPISRDNFFQEVFHFTSRPNELWRRNLNRRLGALLFLALASLAIPLFAMAQSSAAQGGSTYKGEITDEHLNCVQTPVKAVPGVTDKASCVLYWAHFVQPPSKYVLYDAGTKTTYQLDDQNLVQPYVGEKVDVTGKLDAATKTIKVTGIKVQEETYKKS